VSFEAGVPGRLLNTPLHHRRYCGLRLAAGQVMVWCEDEEPAISRRRSLGTEGPPGPSIAGFEWGYCGSGPARLALAILDDYLADGRRAMDLCQEFKRQVIANLPRHGWVLTARELDEAIRAIEAGARQYARMPEPRSA
jgi:hypothetical protein